MNTTPLHKRNPTETYYVSGPMRDIPKFNFPMFDSCSSWLRSLGFGAINPADHDREIDPDCESKPGFETGDESLNDDPNMHFQALLGWDLQQISAHSCTGIVLLPGWEKSRGAAHERYVAEACGKQIWLAHCQKVVVNPGPDESWADDWYMTRDDDRLLSSFTAEKLRAALAIETVPTRDGETQEAWHRDLQHVRQGSPFTHPNRYDSLDDVPRYGDQIAGDSRVTSPQAQIGQFQTKDSGARVQFESGMVRDVQDDKPRYDLIPLAPLQRLAELYARGAVKYGDRNWQKANSQDELDRFHASAFRHFIQYLKGDRDEDHGIAVVWNIFAAIWLEERLSTVPSVMENDKDA